MGCSASKPVSATTAATRSARNSESFSSPSPSISARSSPAAGRAFSLSTPLVHHPPAKKGDTHHLVSLTSTTYGSLLLIDRPTNVKLSGRTAAAAAAVDVQATAEKRSVRFSGQISLSPDSVINTWELMDGLDDNFDSDSDQIPVRTNSIPAKPSSIPALPISIPAKPSSIPILPISIPVKPSSIPVLPISIPVKPSSIPALPISIPAKPSSIPALPISIPAKPSSENGFEATFKKNPAKMEEEISSIPPWSPKKPLWKHISEESLLAKLDPNVASTYMRALSSRNLSSDHPKTRRSSSFSNHWPPNFPDAKNRAILIYFTSLRGIRKTYEDCCLVRTIFRGFRVLVDERDISMDSFFKKELQGKLGGAAPTSLPQVFIGGKHVGGAEEIRQMNESGELAVMLAGFPTSETRSECGRCGDARFVPCPNCNGSRKLFGEDGSLRRCSKCNENGLIRCPFCCSNCL